MGKKRGEGTIRAFIEGKRRMASSFSEKERGGGIYLILSEERGSDSYPKADGIVGPGGGKKRVLPNVEGKRDSSLYVSLNVRRKITESAGTERGAPFIRLKGEESSTHGHVRERGGRNHQDGGEGGRQAFQVGGRKEKTTLNFCKPTGRETTLETYYLKGKRAFGNRKMIHFWAEARRLLKLGKLAFNGCEGKGYLFPFATKTSSSGLQGGEGKGDTRLCGKRESMSSR